MRFLFWGQENRPLVSQAGDLPGYYVDDNYVMSDVWIIEEFDGMVRLNRGCYEGTTYYFAIKIGWDK